MQIAATHTTTISLQNILFSRSKFQLSLIFKKLKSTVTIVEVGARDGLQYEKVILPWTVKVGLIDRLSETGITRIECGSFVNPKMIPQLSDAKEVFANINYKTRVRYSALVPNIKGMRAAIECNLKEIAVFGAASEKFTQKNINCSIEESFLRFKEVIDLAKQNNIIVRGYLSCVIACPYAGKTNPKFVAELTKRMIDMGCFEVSLGDTIGIGQPDTISTLLTEVLKICDSNKVALHCHDTNGMAIMNIHRALEMGIGVFDCSIGGLGGCPFAGPSASGNVSTEKVVDLFATKGILNEAIDVDKVKEVGSWITNILKERKLAREI